MPARSAKDRNRSRRSRTSIATLVTLFALIGGAQALAPAPAAARDDSGTITGTICVMVGEGIYVDAETFLPCDPATAAETIDVTGERPLTDCAVDTPNCLPGDDPLLDPAVDSDGGDLPKNKSHPNYRKAVDLKFKRQDCRAIRVKARHALADLHRDDDDGLIAGMRRFLANGSEKKRLRNFQESWDAKHCSGAMGTDMFGNSLEPSL
jgi:hypothetical protein